MLIERIGVLSTLNQLAEENAECGKAALKLFRLLDEKNPVYHHETGEIIEIGSDEAKQLYSDLEEEIADVLICADELTDAGIISESGIESFYISKRKRMHERFKDEYDERNE